MDFDTNGFEDLEPRATPQPTLLKCMTDPSVPEVSLMFGKLHTSQSSANSNISEDKCRVYANWRTVGFPSVMDSRSITQESPNGQRNIASPRLTNVIPSNPPNFCTESFGRNNRRTTSSSNSSSMQNRDQRNAVQKHCVVAASGGDGTSPYSYEQHFQDESASSPGKRSIEGPFQNSSYNAVRSILKSSSSNNSVPRPSSDGGGKSDGNLRTKTPSQSSHHHYKTRRYVDASAYSPSSPISRCQHADERNHESDTVRDLLLLVKNQNEQIKSLQSQVERLLEIHERNIGYLENRRSVVAKSSESPPAHTHDAENLRRNVPATARSSYQSRGIDVISSFPPDEQTEVSTRKTIMEKKVSIGVMTSFEFSVQNNPFASGSDASTADTHRDSGQRASTSGDPWSSRNVPTGLLENISENTESHSSSIWKPSDNARLSSDKLGSGLAPYENDDRAYGELSPNSKALPVGNSNDSSIAFPNKPSNSSASIGNSRSCKAPEISNKLIENLSKSEVCSPNNRLERGDNFSHRQGDPNDYDRMVRLESSDDVDLKKTKRGGIHCYSEQSNGERRGIPAENTANGSFVLRSSDVRVPDRSLLSLDPSIHVEMGEYSSDDENEEAKRTPAVGWTFYKNVVGQVNRILHSMPGSQDVDENEKINPITFHNDIAEKKDILNSVKSATLEQLKMLGISYAEHSQFNGEYTQKKVTFDSSYRPSVDCQIQNLTQQSSNSMGETNTSMHMKTLALKYLSDEQLADLAVHKQGVGASMKHKFLSVQGTNMSFATMNYLQRYCLVSGMQTVNAEGKGHASATRQKKYLPMTKESQSPARNHSTENSVHTGARDNILDITTLKQQPKLL